jgi:hypothetical protein
MKTGKIYLLSAIVLALVIPGVVYGLTGGTTNFIGLMRVFADSSFSTPSIATAAGEIYAEGDLEADGNINIAGTSTLTGAVTATAGVTLGSGADLTFANAESIDNDTDDIVCINGSGGTSDEDICFDVDGTNIIDISSNTGVTDVDFNAIDVISDYFEFTTTAEALYSNEDEVCMISTGGTSDEDLCFDLDGTNTVVVNSNTSVASVDFENIDLITDNITFTTTAEFIDSSAGDICFNGSGGSNNEDVCIDTETAANTIDIFSNTGVSAWDFNAIDVISDVFAIDTTLEFIDGGTDTMCFNGAGGATYNEDLCFGFEQANSIVVSSNTSVASVDFAAIDVISDQYTFTTTGEFLSSDAAGEVCVNGAGGTNNEDLCFDTETTANTIEMNSNTSVAEVDFNAIDLATDALNDVATITGSNADTIGNGTDGSWILTSSGGTYDEDLEIDLDAASNVITLSSSTSAHTVNFSSLAVQTMIPAMMLSEIRFCGNLPGGGTAATSYAGPEPYPPAATYDVGGAGCDGLDHATIANVDDAWPENPIFGFKVTAMACSAVCSVGGTPDDTLTFTLMDDTVASTNITCNVTLSADGTAEQCTVLYPAGENVAGGSLLAIKMESTDDDCDDASDDLECRLFLTWYDN